MYTDQLSMLL